MAGAASCIALLRVGRRCGHVRLCGYERDARRAAVAGGANIVRGAGTRTLFRRPSRKSEADTNFGVYVNGHSCR